MGALGAALVHVRDACATLRGLVRELSAASGVPIEPPSQTALLDATSAVRGVLRNEPGNVRGTWGGVDGDGRSQLSKGSLFVRSTC